MSNETVVTASINDNYWVSHHIPRSDLQYTWLTASIHTSTVGDNPYPPSASTFGHAPASGYVSSSFIDINGARIFAQLPAYNFVSASTYVSYAKTGIRYFGKDSSAVVGTSTEPIPTDFVGMNTNVVEPITSSNNFLGLPNGVTPHYINIGNLGQEVAINTTNRESLIERYADAGATVTGPHVVLNAVLLHRNGPYHHPSWKQIRTAEHPIARKHRKTNILSVQDIAREIKVEESDSSYAVTPLKALTFTQYNEPPATSKFMPVDHNIKQTGDLVPHWYRYTHGNNQNMFSYNNLNDRLGLSYEGGTIYDEFFNVYNNSDENNPVEEFIGLTYKEIVYPREINTFLSGSRKRENFIAEFWKTLRSDRNSTSLTNSQGYESADTSIWAMDARNNFATADAIGQRGGTTTTNDASGELQNGYTIFHMGGACTDGQLADNASLSLNNFASTDDGRNLDEYVQLVSASLTDPGQSHYYRYLNYPSSGVLPDDTHTVATDNASGSWSISGWLKTAAASSAAVDNDMTIVSKYKHTGNEKHYRVNIDSNNGGNLKAKLGTTEINSGINVCDNRWHHFVYTVDGTKQHLWVDGVHKISGDTAAGKETPQDVLIGSQYNSSGNPEMYFSGNIKHVSLWNTFLTSSVADVSANPVGHSASAGMIYDLYNEGCPTDLSQYQSSSVLFNGQAGINNYLESAGLSGGTLTTLKGASDCTISIWCRTWATASVTTDVTVNPAISGTLYYASSSTGPTNDYDFIKMAGFGVVSASFGGTRLTSGAQNNWAAYAINDGHWHHIVLTNDTSDVTKLYVDGLEADSNTSADDVTNTGPTVVIGSGSVYSKTKDHTGWEGYIDEVSTWSEVLTAAQVLELYATGSPQNLNNHTKISALLSWYRMGDDARDSVAGGSELIYDQTSNGYHLTGNNFAGNFGIVNHGPEGLDAWYRFDQLDTDYNTTKTAYVYNHLTKDKGTFPYADLKTNTGDPTTMFSLDAPCSVSFITCSAGVVYTRRTPEYATASGVEVGYFAGDALWEAGAQSGKDPFYNSYDDYREDIRGIGKDYTILPEFRISEHMNYYVITKNYDFLATNDGFLSLTGSAISSSSETAFFEKYNHSDFLKYFDIIEEDHKSYEKEKTLTLKCKALIKFLPYDGFYPAERTLQLATLFSQSYSAHVNPEDYGGGTIATPFGTQPSWRTFIAPLFGPGVLYNSIKSGVAVDWPQMTSSFSVTGSPSNNTEDLDIRNMICSPRINSSFGYRIPFEALVEPENYLTVPLVDMECHHSAALDSTASWTGNGEPLYRMAMHNFLAESTNLFLENNNVTTITSWPDNDPNYFYADESKTYKMRIVLRNSELSRKKDIFDELPGYFFTWISGSSVTKPTMTMYDRPSAFGPPVQATQIHRHESYESFTPPYYDGYSEVELTFNPDETRRYYLDEIVSQMSSSYTRVGTQFVNFDSNASGSRMHITASVNVDVITKLDNITYEALTGRPVSVIQDENTPNVWTIQPKWETPILDFGTVSVTSPAYGTGSITRGMWHQYGNEPSASQGIYLEVQDFLKEELVNPSTTGSLADLVGFSKEPVKLGKVGQDFTIREAIVAVPFIEEGGDSKFFKISRQEIDAAKLKLYMPVTNPDPNLEVGDSIVNMVDSMSRYVFPPKMDFLTYDLPSMEPFAMYIFEFEHALTRKDLTDMWQNLPPDIGRSFKTDTVTIQHKMLESEFFRCEEEIPDKLRWMVFKVKQKAEKNYFDKIRKSVFDKKYQTYSRYGTTEGSKDYVPPFSFNWPYDFFSLVEMAKLEADVEIGGAGPLEVVQPPLQVIDSIISEPAQSAIQEGIAALAGRTFTLAQPELQVAQIVGTTAAVTVPTPTVTALTSLDFVKILGEESTSVERGGVLRNVGKKVGY